ncbi:MAG: AlpA family phage regulatory protein [Boseongicola sp.]|nr:AlpA family phage regulatory protein [Boseongicola sp.]
MPDEIWRKPKVLAAIGMGNTWLYQAVARGDFPNPVKLGSRAVGWRRTDIETWLAGLEQTDARKP